MPSLLDVRASSAVQIVEFEDAGRAYRLRYSWVDRLKAYYLDVDDQETGARIAANVRLSPRAPLVELPSGGLLYGVGDRDPYAFEDLGASLYVGQLFPSER